MRTLSLGLLAHVDAGKTTLSEGMLYLSGRLRKLGRVDHRDAFLDTDVQERERGITIFSKQAELMWKDVSITLLDTPGHVDFSSEMERTLQVLDAAVLVISAADGVQGHTLTLWRLLRSYGIPTFLFVNKMDQPGTDRAFLMSEIRRQLGESCIDLGTPEAMEQIAMCSEEALTYYLEEGSVPQDVLRTLVRQRQLFPCCFGSALKVNGVETLLDTLVSLLPERAWPDVFSARVYKIARDPQGARLTYLKVTGGTLRVRELLTTPDWEEKVSQIRLYSGAKFRTVEEAPAGTVCAVTGLTHTRAGDGLGAESAADAPLLTPVFTYQVLLPVGYDAHTALQKLHQLEEEDPQLHVIWHEQTREIHVQLMGEVQLEILRRLLKDRFDLPVAFGEGSILYRETIEDTVVGCGHYEPLRHYAEAHIRIEPLENGSGVQVASDCPEDTLARNWQRLIMTHLGERTHRGVLTGSPLTDVKMTLLTGRAHLKHTEGGDFRQATYRAVRQGLMQAKSVLLEPWYDIRLDIPAECVGRAMTDIQQMGGSFAPPETTGDRVTLLAAAPVSAAQHYAREVTAYTRGRGQIVCTLRGYQPCRNQDEVVSAIGYDPERDISNPADSVFCSHGAGFIVPWHEAESHMHLHPGEEAPIADEAITVSSVHRGYSGTAEEDKHLMAIFERTYGPSKQRTNQPPMRQNRATVNNRPIEMAQQGPEYLLVDGYNIIFAWDELKELAAASLDHARQSLMDILCNYRGFKPCEVILVFDSYKVHNNPGATEDYQGIHIVYTREAETADNYIEKTIREIARHHRVRVATSDALEQLIILGGGALRVSAKEFYEEVKAARVEIAEILARNNRERPDTTSVASAMQQAIQRKTP